MHTTKKHKKNYGKEKFRYSDLFPVAVVQPPPRKYQKSSFSNSDVSKKEIVHKHHSRPIIYRNFSPWRKSSLTK
jgi:hypothetical protein